MPKGRHYFLSPFGPPSWWFYFIPRTVGSQVQNLVHGMALSLESEPRKEKEKKIVWNLLSSKWHELEGARRYWENECGQRRRYWENECGQRRLFAIGLEVMCVCVCINI